MLVELIHKFLNLVAPPFTFFSLLLFLPPFQIFKFCLSILSTLFSEDVAGKVVIVTGASSGIGEYLAYEYAKRGACLTLAARRERSLNEVAERARELGSPDVITIQADVSKADNCKMIVDQTMSHFGQLDHLVNNAGVLALTLFEDAEDVSAFKSVMDINFWGSVYMTSFAIPYLRYSGGRIIVLSSSATWLPAPRSSFYNASKAAVSQFFETLRIELGQDIKITLVTPGFVESEIMQGKYIGKGGDVEVDQEMMEVNISVIPVLEVESCAKTIVNSVCRDERYLTVPSWFRVSYLWTVFAREVFECVLRLIYLTGPGTSPKDAIGKKIADYTGARNVLYPETMRAAEIKSD
ncbi:unnamed protein product [Withania somnifera]